MNRYLIWIAIVAVAGYILATRLLWLEVDPPHSLHKDVLSDEGWWSHNAKLHAEFDQWSMDEHNPPLVSAPLYTLALRAVYAVAGVGLWQTRLLAALSGIVSCLLVFVMVRRHASTATATLATALLAADYFVTLHHRVGFVESFQLAWIVASVAAFSSRPGPASACKAGLFFALAVLAKLSAVGLAFVFLAYWAYALVTKVEGRRPIAEGLAFLASCVVVLGSAVLMALPHWSVVTDELASNYTEAAGDGPTSWLNFGYLGVDPRNYSLMGGFLPQCWPMIAAVCLLALEALFGPRRESRDANQLRIICWIWFILGIGFVALQRYQPDRRYLWVIPPMVVLVALRISEGGLRFVGPRSDSSRTRTFIGAALIAAVGGLYAKLPVYIAITEGHTPWVGDWVLEASRRRITLAYVAVILAGMPLCYFAMRFFRDCNLKVPTLLVFLAVAAAGPGRHLYDSTAATRSIPEAIERVKKMSASWPEDDRVAVGDQADLLTLGTGLRPVVVRDWDSRKLNLKAVEQLHPRLALWHGKLAPGLDAYQELQAIPLCPGRDGTPRLVVTVLLRR